MLAVCGKVALRREDDPSLFRRRDTGPGTTETGIAAQADFNEDQRLSVAADQIDLATAAAIIACRDGQAAFL